MHGAMMQQKMCPLQLKMTKKIGNAPRMRVSFLASFTRGGSGHRVATNVATAMGKNTILIAQHGLEVNAIAYAPVLGMLLVE